MIQLPDKQDLFVGRTQTIGCSADGYPKPGFVWFKDFSVIDFTDPRFNLLHNGSLIISPVHTKDRGQYVCRITQLGDCQGTPPDFYLQIKGTGTSLDKHLSNVIYDLR